MDEVASLDLAPGETAALGARDGAGGAEGAGPMVDRVEHAWLADVAAGHYALVAQPTMH